MDSSRNVENYEILMARTKLSKAEWRAQMNAYDCRNGLMKGITIFKCKRKSFENNLAGAIAKQTIYVLLYEIKNIIQLKAIDASKFKLNFKLLDKSNISSKNTNSYIVELLYIPPDPKYENVLVTKTKILLPSFRWAESEEKFLCKLFEKFDSILLCTHTKIENGASWCNFL